MYGQQIFRPEESHGAKSHAKMFSHDVRIVGGHGWGVSFVGRGGVGSCRKGLSFGGIVVGREEGAEVQRPLGRP